jgi:Uma2 family endonuclease
MTTISKSRARRSQQYQPIELSPAAPPPLEPGDRLTRAEFERRYAAMPGLKKAELIEGVVYMPSPVHHLHSQAHSNIMTWLGVYRSQTPELYLNDNATVRLDLDNEVQPDALLRLAESVGGQSWLSDDGYIEGAPEFVVEIAGSSVSYDLHQKREIYRRSGVREYLVWRVYDNALDWFVLRQEIYQPLTPDESGCIESTLFPGLRLLVSPLLADNMVAVLAELQKGLASDAYTTFARNLQAVKQLDK